MSDNKSRTNSILFRIFFIYIALILINLVSPSHQVGGASFPAVNGLSCTPLDPVSTSANTGEKPQSKVWTHDGEWWAVFPANTPAVSNTGTWLWKSVGTTWTEHLKLSDETGTMADVKSVGNLAHILLYDSDPELVSVEYVGGAYGFWSDRPAASPIILPDSEIATIDIDSTGRMWLATESGTSIVVYNSISPYDTWSGPLTLATGISTDDLSVVTALPNNTVGVLWSNQSTTAFGFRVHVDGADASIWSADEVPAVGSGGAFADDHVNVAVASDGTLYAAVKREDTGVNANLLVRRPGGTWDPIYTVDTAGTRPIVVLNESMGMLQVIYTDSGIVYKETATSVIDFSGPSSTLISGGDNNASSTKQNYTDELVVIASDTSNIHGVICTPWLVAHYKMEEGSGTDLLDASGFGNDGSLSGTPGWVSGIDGLALDLDGTNDFGLAVDTPSLDIEDEITLAVWVKPERTATQYLIKKATQGGTNGYELSLASTGKAFARFNQATAVNLYRVDSTTSYPTSGSEWVHLAVTFDGSDIRFYYNGVLETGPLAGPTTIATNSLSLGIGAQSDGAYKFQGQMDDARVYRRALSPAEILALATVPGDTADLSITKDDGLTEADPGDPVTYTIEVTNDGPDDALGAVVSDVLPSTVTGAGWSCASVGGASCTASGSGNINDTVNLPANSVLTYTVSATFDSGAVGVVSNTATVTPPSGVTDSDPNNNDAADVTFLPEGDFALDFDGSTGYVSFGNTATLGLSTFTLETWFKREGPGDTFTTGTGGIPNAIPLVTKGRGEGDGSNVDMNYFLGIDNASGTLAADFEDLASGLNHPIFGKTIIANDTWYHAAVTYNGTSWQLFLNGTLENELAVNQTPRGDSIQHAGLATAMTSTGARDGYFNGLLDEVRIWNYARSGAEILSAMNSKIVTPQAGLVARWGLNEGTGAAIDSSAGSSLPGTIGGTYTWMPGAPFDLPIPISSDLAIDKDDSLSSGIPGASVTYEVTVNNNGPDDVTSISISDVFPDAVVGVIWSCESSSGASCSATGSGSINDVVDLAAGSIVTYTVEASFDATASGAVNNSAALSLPALVSDPDPSNNRATDVTDLGPLPDDDYGLDFSTGASITHVTFGNAAALGLPTFTLETWFKREGTGLMTTTGTGGITNAVPLVTKGRGEGDGSNVDMNYFLGIDNDSGVLAADFEEGASGSSPGLNHKIVGTTVIANDVWYHAAATYDGNKWQLFLNGNLEVEAVVGQPPRSDSIQHAGLATAMTSAGSTGAAGQFDGVLDEVRIWDYARSQAEINATKDLRIASAHPGLVARWGLDEGTGTAVYGSAGTSVDGSIVNGNYNWVSLMPSLPPVAPSDLLAAGSIGSQITVTWTDNSDNEDDFEIERSTGGGGFTLLTTVGSNVNNYVDAGLEAGTEYCYQVRATNGSGNSSFSNTDCSTTPTDPNNALDFGSSNAYVTFGQDSTLGLSSFTLETWFKREGPGTTADTGTGGFLATPLVTKGRGETEASNVDMNYFLGIRGSDNVLAADFEEGASGSTPGLNHPVIGVTPIVNDTWYHAAVTYDGTTWQLFLNGNLETELMVGQPVRSDSIQHAGLATAMNSGGAESGHFDGLLDEVRIWDYARSQTEIRSSINSQITTTQPGLVGRWGLDEGMGVTAYGSAGTSVDGTIANSGYSWVAGAPFNININTPPSQPILVQPLDTAGDIANPPTLEVTVSDPESDSMTVTFYGRPASLPAGPTFDVIVLPDTQYYSESYPAIFITQTQWIVDNKDLLNIAYVAHEGDIVNVPDSATQWVNADNAMSLLENPVTTGLVDGIPFGVVPGNHDEGSLYNTHFGVGRFCSSYPTGCRSYYGDGYPFGFNESSYTLFSASGMEFIVINLDYETPAAGLLDWADLLLKDNSAHRAIVVSHSILDSGGNFNTWGQQIYDALKDNANLFLMLGGHTTAEAQRVDTFDGNTIHTLLADFQSRANGGDGWLRILEFSPADNEIQVKTYSPKLDAFETDADSEFTLAYEMQGDYEMIGQNMGVASGTSTSVVWPGLDALSEYEWYVTVSDGANTISGPNWTFTTADVTAPMADLAITKDDGQTLANPGDSGTYTITVTNNGPDDVTGAAVSDTFPSELTGISWTCLSAGGASCTAGGSGNLNETVDLPIGGVLTYTVDVTYDTGAVGFVNNTASVTPPVMVDDPILTNNAATDTTLMDGTGDPSLVAYYAMEEGSGENLLDSSFYGNDGAIKGSPGWEPGVFGLGLVVDGSNDYASITDTASLDIENEITMAAWIKPQKTGTQDLIKKQPGNGTEAYELVLSTSGYAFVEFNGGYRTEATTLYGDHLNEWVHLAATYDGSTVRLYVNGVEEATTTAAITISTNDQPLTIGADSIGERLFQGQLDEVRIYDRALSVTEITQLAGANLSITKDDGLVQAAPGDPVSYIIEVANSGPYSATGAVVNDTLPPEVTGASWSCVSVGEANCTAGGLGNINDIVDLSPGSVLTYTVNGTFAIGASGLVSNTASVTPPAEVIDPDPAENSATDYTNIIPKPEINHTPITSAEVGLPLVITATVTTLSPPLNVTLYYSKTGDSAYTSLPMVNTGGDIYEATIPGTAVLTPTLRYYVEASDNIYTTINGPHPVEPNQAPIAVDDSYNMNANDLLLVPAPGVLDNDSDGDGDPLIVVLVTDVSSGTLVLRSDGSFNYTPTIGYHGNDFFTYKADDGQIDSNTAVVTITIAAVKPTTPMLLLPGGIIANDTPTYSWETADFAESYLVLVVDDQGNTVVNQTHQASAVCSAGVCAITPTVTLSSGYYSWYVRARNSIGSTWSSVNKFTVFSGSSPSAPAIIAPIGTIGEQSPTYTWSEATDALQYSLFVADAGRNQVVNHMYSVGDVCSSGTCSVTPDEVLPEGAYLWFVRAINPLGKAWSVGKNFTVFLGGTPTKPLLIAPIGVSGEVTPTYSWTESVDALDYLFVVVDEARNTVINESHAAVDICSGGVCTVTPTVVLNEEEHLWFVRASNPLERAWSAGKHFTVFLGGTPGTPVPTAPTGTISEVQPTYSWIESTDALQYLLVVVDSLGNTVTNNWYAADGICNAGVCSTTPTEVLTAGAYAWYARAGNPIGNTWSSRTSFTVVP